MTLATHEFIRRFLIHVLPAGFQLNCSSHLLTTPWHLGELLRKFELTGDLLPGGAQRDSNGSTRDFSRDLTTTRGRGSTSSSGRLWAANGSGGE
jgi:hypothetical protein